MELISGTMDSGKEEDNKRKYNRFEVNPVPVPFREVKQNFTINTNIHNRMSKKEIISQAFKFHSQGNTKEAVKYYKYFLDQGFTDAIVFSNYGMILKDQGRLEEAEDFLRNSIKLNPYFVEAYSNLGTILRSLGELNEAEEFTRQAIKINPDFAGAHTNLALILKDLGMLEESELQKNIGINIDFINNISNKSKNLCLKYLTLSKSQFRQDLFVLSELNFKKKGFFVEFGACDGVISSNSYLLEKSFGWDGILAEPAIYWHDKLIKMRSAIIEKKCLWKDSDEHILFNETEDYKQLSTINSFSDLDNSKCYRTNGNRYKVPTISLLDLLDKYNAPKSIDYLSIDTEGSEFEILKSFDFSKYKFKVITCEHNFTNIREKIYNLLINNGYKRKLKLISKVDDWYVLDE
ncbi:FkbM family methyltransferase [Prochlorococcus marinus]|uniref:FkbM family methyltransferase n=1 Tax=Prochlorococcus marinus TaxID=1219 RepID=UPI0022B451C3|nr:FkbM family methyltransferase [Prochlorococcus marinus]